MKPLPEKQHPFAAVKNKTMADAAMKLYHATCQRLGNGVFNSIGTSPGCDCGDTDNCDACRTDYIATCERLAHGQQRLGLLLYP